MRQLSQMERGGINVSHSSLSSIGESRRASTDVMTAAQGQFNQMHISYSAQNLQQLQSGPSGFLQQPVPQLGPRSHSQADVVQQQQQQLPYPGAMPSFQSANYQPASYNAATQPQSAPPYAIPAPFAFPAHIMPSQAASGGNAAYPTLVPTESSASFQTSNYGKNPPNFNGLRFSKYQCQFFVTFFIINHAGPTSNVYPQTAIQPQSSPLYSENSTPSTQVANQNPSELSFPAVQGGFIPTQSQVISHQ
jgi:hypothetical protein